MPYRLLFFGTSDFAVPSLRSLIQDPRFTCVGLVTQPDRPVGRHAILTPPPVKKIALEAGISPIWQPEKLSDPDVRSWLTNIAPTCDALVVIAYGNILPAWLLELPTHGVINVHGSLLPRWRGASPIQAAIAAGDALTGVTIMKMDALLDHGPIIAIAEEPIKDTDTGATLHDRLAKSGADILPSILSEYIEGNTSPVEQTHELATICRTLTRDDGRIDWTRTATDIERLIRAYTPWPGTWTTWQGKRLKILRAALSNQQPLGNVGEFHQNNGRLLATCGQETTLELLEIQLEGKKPIPGNRLF